MDVAVGSLNIVRLKNTNNHNVIGLEYRMDIMSLKSIEPHFYI